MYSTTWRPHGAETAGHPSVGQNPDMGTMRVSRDRERGHKGQSQLWQNSTLALMALHGKNELKLASPLQTFPGSSTMYVLATVYV